MKYIKGCFLLLLVVVIVGALYLAIQPSTYDITKSRDISLHHQVILSEINNPKNWKDWSTWQKVNLIPAKKHSDTLNTKQISFNVTLKKANKATAYWALTAKNKNTTSVTLGLKGKLSFKHKIEILFGESIEETIANEITNGLKKLDSTLIAKTNIHHINYKGTTIYGGGFYLYNTSSSNFDELSSKIQEKQAEISSFFKENHINTVGKPFTIYHKRDLINNAIIFSCALATTTKVMVTTQESEILTGQFNSFEVLNTSLKGDHKYLDLAWNKTADYLLENNKKRSPTQPLLEVYIIDHNDDPNPANWVTELYTPITSTILNQQ